jgi:hypothetical protein
MQDVETGRVKAVYGYEGLEARVGDDAVAIADCERFARAAAGDRGVAIARGTASGAEAGQGAIVIAADHAAAGDSSIAIARSGEARAGMASIVIGHVVSGGRDTLLVSRWYDWETRKFDQAVGVVGVEGIEPDVAYTCKSGVLSRVDGV